MARSEYHPAAAQYPEDDLAGRSPGSGRRCCTLPLPLPLPLLLLLLPLTLSLSDQPTTKNTRAEARVQ